jgi:outer membrane protein assembly factor BamB
MRGTIRGRAVLTALLAVGTVGGVTAIASTAATASTAAAASTATATPAGWPRGEASATPGENWPTYDQNTRRTGIARGLAAVGALRVAWRARLDGAVYGQPLIIGSNVVVATENDTIYALQDSTGAIVWRTKVGAAVSQSALHGCGDIFPLGITGTPVYDQANGLVYAVAETTGYRHTLFGLSITDGAVKVERYIPTPDGQQAWDLQRPALTIAGGRVYIAFGGLAGDCGPYRGSVVGVPVSGSGPIISYVVPTARAGAIWGTGGPVLDSNDTLYVATGNGAATGGRYDGSDSVIQLSLALHRIGFFAPATWAYDNGHDLDLGSTQPALAAGGAVFQVGKRGVGYLLKDGHLGNIGGAVAQAAICEAFGTAAVSGSTVYEPCTSTGLTAVSVSVARKRITILWRGPADAHGSAAIGGGVIWVPDSHDGILYALRPATGAVLRSVALGVTLPRFSSVSLGAGRAYLGTTSGVAAVSGA